MKFLESPELLALTTHFLTRFPLQDVVIDGMVEAYSCKKTVEDKKLSKALDRKLVAHSASPKLAASPLGPLAKAATRKLLINLVSTLNAAFSDYDFSDSNPKQFEPEDNIQLAINMIDERLLNTIEQLHQGKRTEFWTAIDDMIQLNQCQVFRYIPDPDQDAMSNGKLWSFTYFFYNKKLNRVLLFSAAAERRMATLNLSQDDTLAVGVDSSSRWTPTEMQIATESVADAAYVVKSPRVGPLRSPLEPSPFEDFATT